MDEHSQIIMRGMMRSENYKLEREGKPFLNDADLDAAIAKATRPRMPHRLNYDGAALEGSIDETLAGMIEHLCFLRDVRGQETFWRGAQPFDDGYTYMDLTIELEDVKIVLTQTQGMQLSMFARALDRWETGAIEIPISGSTLDFNPLIDEWKAANPAPRMHSTPEWDAHGRVEVPAPAFEL